MKDDLQLRRELLHTQQKLLTKMKEVKKLENTLQTTLNNSTVLAGRNYPENRVSNISRRASFFHSTVLLNNSIKVIKLLSFFSELFF